MIVFTLNREIPLLVGLSLLCFKIRLICFLAFPQISAYYASFYAFHKCIMLSFYAFFVQINSSCDRM